MKFKTFKSVCSIVLNEGSEVVYNFIMHIKFRSMKIVYVLAKSANNYKIPVSSCIR